MEKIRVDKLAIALSMDMQSFMSEPDSTNEGKADEVAEKIVAGLQKCWPYGDIAGRNRQLKHKQSDGQGKDAVRKGIEGIEREEDVPFVPCGRFFVWMIGLMAHNCVSCVTVKHPQ
jgi:hypothetical protein